MKRNAVLLLFGLVTLLYACKTESQKSSRDLPDNEMSLNLDWLIGNWVYIDEDGALHEDWIKENDSTLMGDSYLIQELDTVFFQKLKLQLQGDTLIYQNLTDSLAFTRPFKERYYPEQSNFSVLNFKQSFPRKINYNFISDTVFIMEISGFVDGSEEKQPFIMERIKIVE